VNDGREHKYFLFYFKDLLHRNSLKYMWGYKIVPTIKFKYILYTVYLLLAHIVCKRVENESPVQRPQTVILHQSITYTTMKHW